MMMIEMTIRKSTVFAVATYKLGLSVLRLELPCKASDTNVVSSLVPKLSAAKVVSRKGNVSDGEMGSLDAHKPDISIVMFESNNHT
jgi:hypothetical protein